MKFEETVKKEIGVDLEGGFVKAGEFVDIVKNSGNEFGTVGTRWVSEFVDWNRLENWKVTQFSFCNGILLLISFIGTLNGNSVLGLVDGEVMDLGFGLFVIVLFLVG